MLFIPRLEHSRPMQKTQGQGPGQRTTRSRLRNLALRPRPRIHIPVNATSSLAACETASPVEDHRDWFSLSNCPVTGVSDRWLSTYLWCSHTLTLLCVHWLVYGPQHLVWRYYFLSNSTAVAVGEHLHGMTAVIMMQWLLCVCFSLDWLRFMWRHSWATRRLLLSYSSLAPKPRRRQCAVKQRCTSQREPIRLKWCEFWFVHVLTSMPEQRYFHRSLNSVFFLNIIIWYLLLPCTFVMICLNIIH